MKWIAPSAKDSASATLEKNLWTAADQFRANSGLTAQEYAAPIIGKALNQAMKAIETENTQLAGILPHTYHLFASVLRKRLLRKIAEIPDTLDFDAFGRVYEYFLGAFACSPNATPRRSHSSAPMWQF